jgi:hypothetical protein
VEGERPKGRSKGPPPCTVRVAEPSTRVERVFCENATVTSSVGVSLKVTVRLVNHKRMWKDDDLDKQEEIVSLSPGETWRCRRLQGRCKSGANEYFAKITAHNDNYDEDAEQTTRRVTFSC